MKDSFMRIIGRFEQILRYLSVSILSTIVDVMIVWLLFNLMSVSLGVSNTTGVVAGFIIGFVIAPNKVFAAGHGFWSFMVFFGTFLLGLLMADLLMVYSYAAVETYLSEHLAFLFSKGVSVVIPFFFMYFARKYLYQLLKKREEKQ